VHELRNLGLEVVCLDARHARAALEMQINKTDQNDAEGLAQIVFAPGGTGLFMSSRSTATARVLFWAQGLNSSV
jgi:transposase